MTTAATSRGIAEGDPEWVPAVTEANSCSGAKRIRQLYARGLALDPSRSYVGVVGTRRADASGLELAEEIAGRLAEGGFVVVSGMALGIDGAAHKGALDAGGTSVAVLGCGLDICYPPRHRALKRRLESEGTILSEYPDGTEPESWRFPERNRIIAALSRGTIVIQGGVKSGALITAEFAHQYGRSVIALPGNPLCTNAAGCHQLIRSSTAALVTSVDEILEELAPELVWGSSTGPLAVSSEVPAGLDPADLRVLMLLDEIPRPPVAVATRSEAAPGEVAIACARLEVRGLARKRRAGFIITPAGIRVRNGIR